MADLAEVAGIDYDANVAVAGGDALQDLDGAVLGGVIGEDVLIAVAAEGGHDVADAAVEFLDVTFLVVTGGDDADGFQALASRARTGPFFIRFRVLHAVNSRPLALVPLQQRSEARQAKPQRREL